MKSTLDVVLGCQEPRILVTPPSAGSAGWDLIELCESVGMEFDEGQKLALVEICAEAWPGKWAAMETLLEECRQNGKGYVIEALQLGDLFLFDSLVSTYSAHEFPTASEAHRRLCFWIENNDDLRKRCKKPTVANGNVGVETLSGKRVKFRARTLDGGRGLTGDRIILDEAFDLPSATVGSLVPSLSAVPNPQINYFSSAGFGTDQPKSDVLWSIRCQAIKAALSAKGLPVAEPEELVARGVVGAHVYLNWSAAPSAREDRANERHIARANRAYCRRITPEYVRDVELKRMDPEKFCRERLGIWDPSRKLQEDAKSAPLVAAWGRAPCLDIRSQPVDPVVFSFDVSRDSSKASIGIGAKRSDGLRHVELVQRRPGTAWLVGELKRMVEQWRPSHVVCDSKGPVTELFVELDAAGIVYHKATVGEFAAACLSFDRGVLAAEIRHRDQPELADAIVAAAKKNYGDVWLWGRRESDGDIDSLVAVTLAQHWVAVRPDMEELVGSLMA